MEEEYLYVVAHQSELNETIKDISDKPQLSYFDDWDMKMRWLTALIETELKKAAYFGHHYLMKSARKSPYFNAGMDRAYRL